MTDEEREHYERLAKYYNSKSSKEPKSIYEHIKLLANDYKCWDNTLTHDEAIELDRLINGKSCYKICHKWDSMLEDIKAEIKEEKDCAYADFERYKVDYLGQDWEDAYDSLPQDDFRYGMERALEIINKHIKENKQ